MTVCIAAICDSNTAILVADRMKTAGDIQFEPTEGPNVAVGKIIPMTNSIAVMTAGDAGFQAEMVTALKVEVSKRLKAAPDKWLLVKDVADMYVEIYSNDRRKRINNTLLGPFGLDTHTVISRQSEMSEYFIRNISNQIADFQMPDAALIVAGVDDSGVHVYRLYGADCDSADSVGFACIGSGARHAQTQFMAAGHHRQQPFIDTLMLSFVAKKRAEAAPGVGKQTDMFVTGPQLGSLAYLPPLLEMKKLEAYYKGLQQGESRAFQRAKASLDKYVAEIARTNAAKQEQTQAPTPPSPPTSPPPKPADDSKRPEQPAT
jgi:hypothetical protein